MKKLSKGQKASVVYHDIFDYPLTFPETKRWMFSGSFSHKPSVTKVGDYFVVKGSEQYIAKRKSHSAQSKRKIKIARKAAKIISNIPFVRVVALSGALAMNNASKDSDIDLLIITMENSLWITRPLVYVALLSCGVKVRSPKDKNEEDKLCLNLWMDESQLEIDQKNVYTAHEVSQLVPLVNKHMVFEKLLSGNSWIKNYWPNATKTIVDLEFYHGKSSFEKLISKLSYMPNLAAFKLQFFYMKPKMTKEQVALKRAFFHPRDWGKEIEHKLKVE